MPHSIFYAALAIAFIVGRDSAAAQSTSATTVIGLNYTSFTEVLGHISPSTSYLSINTTSIDTLDFDVLLLYAPQLTHLYVYNNQKLQTTIGRLNFPELQTLVISSNNLLAFPEFESCPKLRNFHMRNNAQALVNLNVTHIEKCIKLFSIILNDIGLSHFPNFTQMSSSILSLIAMNNNNFISVDDGALDGLSRLKRLRLFYNYMTTIPSLRDLVSLEEISIRGNDIVNEVAVDVNWFYSMPNLKLLNLELMLKITSPPDMSRLPLITEFMIYFDASASVYLPADYLDSHPNMKILTLVEVKLGGILPRGPSTYSLTNLRLEHCTIAEITADAFEGFEKLIDLTLIDTNFLELPLLAASRTTLVKFRFCCSRHLTSIPYGYFSNFSKLLEPSIDQNQITEVPFLGENVTVKTLRLEGNKITSIVSNAFEGFCCLTVLNLKQNKLHHISFTIPSTVKTLNLQNNNILNVVHSNFPFNSGSLTNVRLHGNPLECDQKMCFIFLGPWSSIFELDSIPCSAPPDLTGKPKAEVAHSLPCATDACYHVPAIANAFSEVKSMYVWYICNNGLLFSDGIQRKKLRCESAILSTDDILSTGCKEGVGIRKREFVQSGVQSYSDEESKVFGRAVIVKEIEVRSLNDLSCARVCSRLPDCVGYKVVHPEAGNKGKCEVSVQD